MVNSFDLKYLQLAIKDLSKEVHINIQHVTDEFEMLSSFCGRSEQNPLVSIQYESDLNFSGGAKAPPWRQIYGELCYISAQCYDQGMIIITATKKGFFVNKGYTTDSHGTDILNYEANSPIYSSLVELFKAQSPHFAARIDNQEYLFRNRSDNTGKIAIETFEHIGHDFEAPVDNSEEPQSARRKDNQTRVVAKKSKSETKAQHLAEPSLKWKALGLGFDFPKTKMAKIPGKIASSPYKDKRKARKDSVDEDFEESDSDLYSEEEAEKRQDNCNLA